MLFRACSLPLILPLMSTLLLCSTLLAGCGDDKEANKPTAEHAQTSKAAPQRVTPARPTQGPAATASLAASASVPAVMATPAIQKGLRWNGTSSDEGIGLTLFDGSDAPVMTLSCLRNPARFGVAATALAPVAGSSSVSLGVDSQAFAFSLPDNMTGLGAGLHGRGDIPAQLLTALDNDSMGPREIRLNYAGQQLGPYIPPQPEQLLTFVTECRGIASTAGENTPQS